MQTFIFIAYFVLVACVIFFSARLSYYVDLLDKKTSLSSAFIGGVMLAAVTSLPELFTSASSVLLLDKPALVMGNILGSNLFNVLVLGTVFILYFKGLIKSKITASHNTTISSLFVIYAVLSLSVLTGITANFFNISLISIIILVLYVLCIKNMSNDEDTSDSSEDLSSLTLKQVVIRFVAYSVLLIATSIAITYASDYIGEAIGLGSTMAGALLLGIATSLPELISCFVLAKIGNFNAMVGNIVGSNIFNFFIIVFADIIYLGGNLYIYDTQSKLLIFLGLINTIMLMFTVRGLIKDKGQATTGTSKYAIASFIPIVCYAVFVILSTR